MKKIRLFLFILLVFLTACGKAPSENVSGGRSSVPAGSATDTPAATPTPTDTPTPTATPTPTNTPTPTPTPVLETGDYTADGRIFTGELSRERIIEFFLDVVMKVEYGDNDSFRLRKWTDPISVYPSGEENDFDRSMETRLFDTLNEIQGFPGISRTEDAAEATTTVTFLDPESYEIYRKDYVNEENTGGFCTAYFYTATDVYHSAVIGIRSDTDDTERGSVILEELLQSLGLMNDSYLDPESIFYQGFNEPEWPTELDWILVKCLYHPDMKCGMTAEEVTEVLEHILYSGEEED